jgi:hypothetical protein
MPHYNAAVFQGVHHLNMNGSSVYVNQGGMLNFLSDSHSLFLTSHKLSKTARRSMT